MSVDDAIERIETGIAAYRQQRRRRRNDVSTSGASRTRETIMPGTQWETPLFEVDAPAEGPTVFVLAGQQGWEQSGVAAADVVRTMTPETGTVVAIPIANQTSVSLEYEADSLVENPEDHDGDGEADEPNYNGRIDDLPGVSGNMNDHWSIGEQPEIEIVSAIWDRFTAYDPDVAFDLHSSGGIYRHDPGRVGQALFPTPDDPTQNAASVVQTTLDEEYVSEFPECYDYVIGNDQDGDGPLFSHKVGADHDGGGCLLAETTRDGTTHAQRTWWHVATVVHALETVGFTFAESIDAVSPDASASPTVAVDCVPADEES